MTALATQYRLAGTQRRYADAGFCWTALDDARDAGTLRTFRVKYLPASCACCGKSFGKGTRVYSAERGLLVGRCCWWPERPS